MSDIDNITWEELKASTAIEVDACASYYSEFNYPGDLIDKHDVIKVDELPYLIVTVALRHVTYTNIVELVENVFKAIEKPIYIIARDAVITGLYIVEEMGRIIEGEKVLDSPLTQDERAAGYDKLSRFGVLPTLWYLANEDILKMETIGQMPYKQVFEVLYMKKVIAKCEKKLYEINSNKK